MYSKTSSLVLMIVIHSSVSAQDPHALRRIKECLARDGSLVCLKERALDALNETIMSDRPISLYGFLDIVRDPAYEPRETDEARLPQEESLRNARLNELLYEKVEELVESRSFKVNLGSVFEGRGKKDKGSKGGMMMMGGLAMAGMMAQMFMGKIAMMAGAALLVAKLALLLSTIVGLKKLGGGGGGGESTHAVVYAAPAETHGGGGGGGGWHRSIANPGSGNAVSEEVNSMGNAMAYKGHGVNYVDGGGDVSFPY